MARGIVGLVILGMILLAAGCASTSATAPGPAGPSDDPSVLTKLAKGMSGEAVRRLPGNPADVSLPPKAAGAAEIWTYHRTYRTTREVQTSTQSRPAFVGPGRGEDGMGPVEEPVYSTEYYEVNETLKLLMFQDRLLEWKRTATDRRSFY
jgi:hypothetical protein